MASRSATKKSPARGVRRGRKASAPTAGFAETTAFKRVMRLKPGSAAASAVEEARQAGLLDGDASEHMSFRVPKALYEAARREAGVSSPTDLGVAAMALVAQPDPIAAYFRETFGRLGADFDLDY